MDVRDLKTFIYDNEYVVPLLQSVGCHNIVYHSDNKYWSCANPDGDNRGAIVVYDNETLTCLNFTRRMIREKRTTDIIDLICFTQKLNFLQALHFICNQVGLEYYHDFQEDIPESRKIIQDIKEEIHSKGSKETDDKPLKPISEKIITYYHPYVNNIFKDDNISYSTQREFEIGYDDVSNRITIPIRSELGDLVGIKGRYFNKEVPDNEQKYIYLERCSKSKILYGLYKTMPYIKRCGQVYVFESEKSVMQCWDMGYRNAVATGGKAISIWQSDMLIRLGVEIVLAFDKDVDKEYIEDMYDLFPEGIRVSYIYDEENILDAKESPCDNPNKWQILKNNNRYCLR